MLKKDKLPLGFSTTWKAHYSLWGVRMFLALLCLNNVDSYFNTVWSEKKQQLLINQTMENDKYSMK